MTISSQTWRTDAETDRLLRVRQITKLFSISRSGFWRMVKDGKLPGPTHKIGQRCSLWSESELREAFDTYRTDSETA